MFIKQATLAAIALAVVLVLGMTQKVWAAPSVVVLQKTTSNDFGAGNVAGDEGPTWRTVLEDIGFSGHTVLSQLNTGSMLATFNEGARRNNTIGSFSTFSHISSVGQGAPSFRHAPFRYMTAWPGIPPTVPSRRRY